MSTLSSPICRNIGIEDRKTMIQILLCQIQQSKEASKNEKQHFFCFVVSLQVFTDKPASVTQTAGDCNNLLMSKATASEFLPQQPLYNQFHQYTYVFSPGNWSGLKYLTN